MINILLVTFLAVISGYAVYSIFKYTRVISGIFFSLVYTPASELLPSSPGEKVVILDSADKEIEALLLEKKGSKKIAIFCHDSGASKESWEKYAYFLPELGYHMLSVDFTQGPEESGDNSLSQWPAQEEVERLLTVMRWTKKAFSEETKIILFGVSKGANICFAASFQDPRVVAVVADGLFSMKEIFRDYIRKWAPILVRPNFFGDHYPAWIVNTFSLSGFWYCQKKSGKKFIDVEKLLRRKHAPLLMIHGEADDYIPAAHQQLLEKINQDKRSGLRLVVPKAGHNESVSLSRQAYEKNISDFLRKLLP